MYRMVSTLMLLFSLCLPLMAQKVGVPLQGLPNYQERAVYLFVNAARCDPSGFGTSYGKSPNPLISYQPRPPYILHHELNRAARFHSDDMKSCNQMDHSSCDGTSFGARLSRYISKGGGECIARGQQTPLAAVDAWLHSNAGHRDALMSTQYSDIGCGYASGNWWTTDFSQLSPAQTHPVYGGAHHFPASGSTEFLVVYYAKSATSAPTVTLVLDSKASAMRKVLGSNSYGVYSLTVPRATTCRSYYFEVVDAKGTRWRYPEAGGFYTSGEGSCTKDYGETIAQPMRRDARIASWGEQLKVELAHSGVRMQGISVGKIGSIDVLGIDGKLVQHLDAAELRYGNGSCWGQTQPLVPTLYFIVVRQADGLGAVAYPRIAKQ